MVSTALATADIVYEDLRVRILRGALPSGSWLRAETLASELGVSRTPVREALRRLQADGFVEQIPNRGAQVVQIDDADLVASYELRAMLEAYGAKCAAESGNADTGALRDLCTAMEKRLAIKDDTTFDDITTLNMEFHRTIHAAAGTKVLPTLLSGLVQVGLVRHTFDHYTDAEMARSFAQHREIVEAIECGDGTWAGAVMSAHILAARSSLRRRMAGNAQTGKETT